MKKLVLDFLKDKVAAGAAEYAIIASLISVAIITAIAALGKNSNDTFTKVNCGLEGTTNGAHHAAASTCAY